MRKFLNKEEEIKLYKYIQSLVDCNIDTGYTIWKRKEVSGRLDKTWNTRNAGKECGNITKDGYRATNVSYNNKLFSVFIHRLVWFIANEVIPEVQIDHINQIRTDNRLVNLREATSSENCRNRKITSNNSSGVVGVTWNKEKRRWMARATVDGEVFHVGSYKDIDDAEIAIKTFRKGKGFSELHGSV